jgi:hypothetical protein
MLNKSGQIFTALTCASIMLITFIGIRVTNAENEATIQIDPELIQASLGENFTLTINATNVASMGAWQVGLKFNRTVMNLTAMWVPTDNMFGDPAIHPQKWVEPDNGVDFFEGIGYTIFGNSLSEGEVSVTNGMLCRVNCTILHEGATTIQVATKSNRIYKAESSSGSYSFLASWSNESQSFVEIPQPLTVYSAVMIARVPEFFDSWVYVLLFMAVTIAAVAVTLVKRRVALVRTS